MGANAGSLSPSSAQSPPAQLSPGMGSTIGQPCAFSTALEALTPSASLNSLAAGGTSAGRERSPKCDYGPVSLPPSTPGPIYRGGGTGAYLGREIQLRP